MLKFVLNLFICASGAYSAELNIDALRNKYQKLESLSADVEQTKTAPYLLRPLKSQVKFSYRQGTIDWNVVKPFKTNMHIDRTGIIIDGGKVGKNKIPKEMLNMAKYILDLLEGKLSKNDNQISVDQSDQSLLWKPRISGNIGSVKAMKFFFDSKLVISKILIQGGDESTKLVFKKVKLESKGAKR